MRNAFVAEPAPSRAVCFGKLPSRADFVRGGAAPLADWLDRWFSAAIACALEDPQWKPGYDRAPEVRFAVLDAASPIAVCGHLLPSADAAGRRFPFAVALAAETASPRERLRSAPLAFARPWTRCAEAARRIRAARTPAAAAAAFDAELGRARSAPAAAYDAICADHAELETVAGLEQRLRPTHPEVDLRRALLALGVVLQALACTGDRGPGGIALPLPQDPLHRMLVAAWWTGLVAETVAATRRELLLLLPTPGEAAPPRLLLGFDGASPAALRATWDPAHPGQAFADLTAPPWAETHATRDAATVRLAGYLEHGDVSLGLAAASWHDAFGGRR